MFKSTNRGRRTETEEIQFDVTKELRAEQKAFLSVFLHRDEVWLSAQVWGEEGQRRLWDATRANLIFADILWFHLAAVVYRCRSWSEVKAETAWKCFSAWCSYSASDSSSRNTKQCLLSSLKMWACAVVFCFLWFYDGYFCFFPIQVGQIKPGKWHQRVPNYFVDKPLKASEEVVHRHNKFPLLNKCCPLFFEACVHPKCTLQLLDVSHIYLPACGRRFLRILSAGYSYCEDRYTQDQLHTNL